MAAAALLLNVTSCQNEDIVLQQQEETTGQEFTLQATYGASTRTTLEGNGTGYDTKWSAGDQIFVTDGNGFVSGVLTLETGDGQSTGTFKGYVSGNPGALRYAIFPVPADGAIDLSKVDASQVDAPMTAEINAGSASFSNECGLIELTIFNIPEGEDITISEATMPAPINISGSLQVDAEDCSLTPGTPANEITVSNAKSGVPFYVPVIAGSEKSTIILKVSVDGKESKKFNVPIQKGAVSEEKTPDLYVTDDALVKWEEYVPSEDTENPGSYTIKTTPDLLWVAEQVNEEGNTFEGKTLTMAADIDLNGVEWTPIGLNADDAKKFKGTFDGGNYTISNLKVETEAGYTAAGLFGALNGTIQNLTIDGANIKHISTGDATDNGIGAVAGSIYPTGIITNVTVKNAVVEGNRYVGGIAGYVYGSIQNCTVENIELTATPNAISGGYDNGDKVGGIAGYYVTDTGNTCKDNKVINAQIHGYRDLGGLVGCADVPSSVAGNSVENANIIVDQITNNYGEKTANADGIVGRLLNGTELGTGNSSSEITITFLANNTNLQSTLDKIGVGTYTVALIENIKGNATVSQKEGVNIVIDGCEYEYDGTLFIHGNARYEGAETLTIKNVKFNTDADTKDFISSNSTGSVERYAHNVTIENCTFEGSDVAVVGMRLRQAYNILVKGCEATGIHSLSQNTACSYQKYEKCTVSAGSGINILISGNVDVVNCNFTATEDDGYGIRVDAGNANTLNVTGSTIKAYEPVVIRSAKALYKFNLASSTLNTLSGNHIVVKGEMPTMTGVDGLTIKK